FFPHLSSYRPCAVFADLLEWHRQARIGCGQFVFQFTPEEFALVVARAELAGVLACEEAGPDGQAARDALERRTAALVEGFRARPAWETEPGRPAVEAIEGYADRLVAATEAILRMLDFPLPELELPGDLPLAQ